MAGGMTIGQLAAAAGVSVETVRYYQRRGLIDEPRKPPGGQRRYGPCAIAQIEFIRRGQQLGFSLEEIRELKRHGDGTAVRATREIAQRKHDAVVARLEELERVRAALHALIAASKRRGSRGRCPILAALRGEDERD